MRIQPGDFGTSLNRWFRLLGRRWKPLLISSMVAYIPLALVLGILYLVLDVGDAFAQLADPDLVAEMSLSELLDILTPVLVTGLVALVLQLIATMYIYLSASRITAEHFAEMESDWREASRSASKRLTVAIGASLLVFGVAIVTIAIVVGVGWGLIVNLGTTFVSIFLTSVVVLTALVVMVWLSVSVSLYPQSIALTRRGALDCIKESFYLIQGRWWATVGFVLVTSLIASAALQVLNLVLVPLYVAGAAIPWVLAVVVSVTTLIEGPIAATMGTAYAIWYIDLRARREPLEAESLIS
jgi:hypothetical protein